MSRKRPTESPWDSDDDLLNEDLAAITAFPDDKEDELDEDKLLASDEEDLDWNQIGDNVVNQAAQDVSGTGGIELELEPEDEDFLDATAGTECDESGYADQNDPNQEQDYSDVAHLTEEAGNTVEAPQVDMEDEVQPGSHADDEEESDSDNEREVGRGRFRSERTTDAVVVAHKSTRSMEDIPDSLEISQAQQAQIDAYEHRKEHDRRNKFEHKRARIHKKFNPPFQPRPNFQGNRGPFLHSHGPVQMRPQMPRPSGPPRQQMPAQSIAANKILINPHFSGSVLAGPDTRLAYGSSPGAGPNVGPHQGLQRQEPIQYHSLRPAGVSSDHFPRPAVSQAWVSTPQPQAGLGLLGQSPQINQPMTGFQQHSGGNYGQSPLPINSPILPVSTATSQPFSSSIVPPAQYHPQNSLPVFNYNHQPQPQFSPREPEPRGPHMGFQGPHNVHMGQNQLQGNNLQHPTSRHQNPPLQHQNPAQLNTHGPRGFTPNQPTRNQGPDRIHGNQPPFQGHRYEPHSGPMHRNQQEIGQPIKTVVNQRKGSGPPHPDYVKNDSFKPKPTHPQGPGMNRSNFPLKASAPTPVGARGTMPGQRTAPVGGGLTTAQLRNRMAAKKLLAAKKTAVAKRVSEGNGVLNEPSPPKQPRMTLTSSSTPVMSNLPASTPKRTVLKSLPTSEPKPAQPAVKAVPVKIEIDNELAQKLEEQKKKREQIIKMKEMRRMQAAGVRRAELGKRLAEQGKSIEDITKDGEESKSQQPDAKQPSLLQKPSGQQQNLQPQQQRQQQQQQHSPQQQQQHGPKPLLQQQTKSVPSGQSQEAAGRGNAQGRGRGIGLRRPGLGFQAEMPVEPLGGYVGPSGVVTQVDFAENANDFQSSMGRDRGYPQGGRGFPRNRGNMRGRGPHRGGHFHGDHSNRGGMGQNMGPQRGMFPRGRDRGRGHARGLQRGGMRGGAPTQGGEVQLHTGGPQESFHPPNMRPQRSRGPYPNQGSRLVQNQGIRQMASPQQQQQQQQHMSNPQLQGRQAQLQQNAQQRVVKMNSGGGTVQNNLQNEGPRNLVRNEGPGQPGGDVSNTSVTVRIDNLTTNTNDKQIQQLCNEVGPIECITMITSQKRAVVRFMKPEHAAMFVKRYNRFMLDLSHIGVCLLPD